MVLNRQSSNLLLVSPTMRTEMSSLCTMLELDFQLKVVDQIVADAVSVQAPATKFYIAQEENLMKDWQRKQFAKRSVFSTSGRMCSTERDTQRFHFPFLLSQTAAPRFDE